MRISDWSSDVCSSDLGARFAADVVDELGVTGGGAHRERVDFEPVEVGKLEQLDEAGRISLEEIFRRDRQTDANEHEAAQLAGTPAQPRQAETAAGRGDTGKAACGERVCVYVWISVGDLSLTKKKQ